MITRMVGRRGAPALAAAVLPIATVSCGTDSTDGESSVDGPAVEDVYDADWFERSGELSQPMRDGRPADFRPRRP